jgi:uncharacterized membrane protein YgcG
VITPTPKFTDPTSLTFNLTVRRSTTTYIFVIFTALLMWVLSLAVSRFAVDAMLGTNKQIEGPIMGVCVAMVFALPALRNTQPNIPPYIGVLSDVVAFFWAEMAIAGTALCQVVLYSIQKSKAAVRLEAGKLEVREKKEREEREQKEKMEREEREKERQKTAKEIGVDEKEGLKDLNDLEEGRRGAGGGVVVRDGERNNTNFSINLLRSMKTVSKTSLKSKINNNAKKNNKKNKNGDADDGSSAANTMDVYGGDAPVGASAAAAVSGVDGGGLDASSGGVDVGGGGDFSGGIDGGGDFSGGGGFDGGGFSG